MDLPSHLCSWSAGVDHLDEFTSGVGAGGGAIRAAGRHGMGAVVVDSHEVDGRRDGRQVAGGLGGEPVLFAEIGEYVGRIVAAQDRFQEESVLQTVDSSGGVSVGIGVAGRLHRVQIQAQADPRVWLQVPDCCRRAAVSEELVVGGVRCLRAQLFAWGVMARCVSEERRAPRLVQGDPVGDEIPRLTHNCAHVVGECIDDAAPDPAGLVLQVLREVPVIQRRVGCHVPLA